MSAAERMVRRALKIEAKYGSAALEEWRQRRRIGIVESPVAGLDPWTEPSPSTNERFLPGGLEEIHLSPRPKWPVELRNTRALHGLMTAVGGQGHRPRCPEFSLLPDPERPGRWAVYWYVTAVAAALADKTGVGQLFNRPVTVRLGPMRRFRWPESVTPGRYRVGLQTLTPVVIRSSQNDGTKRVHGTATAENVEHALTQNLALRLGIGEGSVAGKLAITMLASQTEPRPVAVGGKFGDATSGVVEGWEGWCLLEVNAVAKWLLECAALIGLGGRTGLGFGRIKVGIAG